MSTSSQIASLGEEFPDELPKQHEIVCGKLVRKAVAITDHGVLQGRIFSFLEPFYGKRNTPGGWWTCNDPEIEFFPKPNEHVYVPDLAGWKINVVPERPKGARVGICPQWVCEILSPSTAHRDKGVKKETYHRAHVEHYWLVAAEKQTLTVLAWAENGYQTVLTAGPGDRVRAEPFAERKLDLGWLFDFE
ncbi:MAG: Uma2 family endonuclease [Proteobacteria bacterium]|nr:Uma2 family endonuclease [Pseudomonadota bacterium]